MITLLRGLHSIAAQRGDGLRPEFLTMTTPSPAWAGVERMGVTTTAGDAGGTSADRLVAGEKMAEVAVMPQRKRNEAR
mgnify:CR=1 FL=1